MTSWRQVRSGSSATPRRDNSRSARSRTCSPVCGKRLVWLMTNWCTRNPKCFTCNFRSQYQRTRKELFPVLSRIQNIGYELGENSRTAEWYRANHRTPWVATTAKGEYRLPFSTT